MSNDNSILENVRKLLDEGKPKEAMDYVRPYSRSGSKALINAYGVCLLRSGQYQEAVNLLRGMVYQGNTFAMLTDTPVVVKINLATALLLSQNIGGCLAILREVRNEAHPASARLEKAIAMWMKNLGLLQRLWCMLGGTPSTPVTLDFPPGEV